ncbi:MULTISPECIES: DUF4442 domain-containing protein [unclassified Pseudofrankia]|uniref:DUF4442 domain-containing protein n=1 Tax=unclassified Pseudofrankia TaxID=2994372 RepID=UPI0008DB2B8D|nr:MULTISPECIES: DUF4442 domain-containing protein [unclassified Pseudofrankia]MDT3439063.1 YiiD C-terminal domain-containing protein [Pseudofrankia sp. BMG5.37]OHV45792.1 DUF4442 domain-containing protein [Pseudofrankia sp. BMG5.36]
MSAQSDIPSALAEARASHLRSHGDTAPDLEQLRQVIDAMVPFCDLVGVRVIELRPDAGVAELPDRPDLRNHMGTVHAGAIFLVAEVSGAAAFSGAMAPRILGVQAFVLRDCRVSYLKPARGRLRAHGAIDTTVTRDVLTRTGTERFDLTGRSLVYDDAGVLVAKVDFDYVATVA